jgi:hypothetical protein
VALWFGLKAWRNLRATQVALVAVHTQQQSVVAGIAREEARLREAQRRAMTSNPPTDQAKLRPPGGTPPAAALPTPRSQSEIISADPKLEVLELKRQRLAMLWDYAYPLHALGLSPAQIERLGDITVKSVERVMDLRAAGRTQDAAGKEVVEKLQRQARAEREESVLSVLGAEGYRRWLELESTTALRNIAINGLAGTAALEGIPLTEQQGEQLIQAIFEVGGPQLSGPRQDLSKVDWDAVEARAQSILSPTQFALFKHRAPPTSFSSRQSQRLQDAVRRAWADDATTAAAAEQAGPTTVK